MPLACAATPRDHAARSIMPPVPHRWETVFLPEATADAFQGEPHELFGGFGRRDHALAVRYPAPLLATAQWDQPPALALDSPRYLFLPRRADTILFFNRRP